MRKLLLDRQKKLLILCNIVAALVLMIIVLWQYVTLGILQSQLVLGGWDAPFYVWQAKTEIMYGPGYFIGLMSYPQLYSGLQATIGFLSGNIIVPARVIPVVMGASLIAVYSIISYRASGNVYVGALTALASAIYPSTIWIVSEYHRTNLALLFGLVSLMVYSARPEIARWRQLSVFCLLTLAAFTEFEVFIVTVLTIFIHSIMTRNKTGLLESILYFAVPAGLLEAIVPSFYSLYYFAGSSDVLNAKWSYIYQTMIFWSVGYWFLLPLLFLGIYSTYLFSKKSGHKLAGLLLIFAAVLMIPALAISQTQFNGLGLRAILATPMPVFVSMGVGESVSVLSKLLKSSVVPPILSLKKLPRFLTSRTVIGSILAAIVLLSLATTVTTAANAEMIPFYKVSAYPKIVAAGQYLAEKGLTSAVFMFDGSSLWNADQYRAIIGYLIGDHLAYYGNFSELLDLKPTISSLPYPEGEIANLTSIRYLNDMLGDKHYLIYYQKSHVTSAKDLLQHPLVVISPELFDSKVPFYVQSFQVSDGIYVVPSISLLVNEINQTMTLMSGRGTEQIQAHLVGNEVIQSLGSGSDWYKLTNIPNYFVLSRLIQGGVSSYPENDPRRVNGQIATVNNDIADTLSYWTATNGTLAIDLTNRMEGNSSLSASMKTDSYADAWLTFQPPYLVDLGTYDTLSFWGSESVANAQWVLVLRDKTGAQASYRSMIGSSVSNAQVGNWIRVVANLKTPTQIDSGFDIHNISSVSFVDYTGISQSAVSFHIDDIIVDFPLVSGEIYKARVLPNQELVAEFE